MKPENHDELFYRIALTQTEFIGDKLARALLSHFGTAKNIFTAKPADLKKLEQFGAFRVKALTKEIDEQRVLKEIEFIEKHGVQVLFLSDDEYPQRLKNCPDAPILLYYKGNADLNAKRIVSIVGTRNNSDYGTRCTEQLVEGLRSKDVLIVSGLASGIDAIAHRRSLQCGIPTVGVVAHGLDRLYPAQHKNLAKEMVHNGGLITEFPINTNPDRQNFPIRNRVVAGMADITVVVETDEKGGSMITAKLATSYNREVAAFPGRAIDNKSRGCNYLIKTNIAHLITSAEDLIDIMNWETEVRKNTIQTKLFDKLSPEEFSITKVLEESEMVHIDELQLKTSLSNSKLSALLLSLEIEGLVKSLPGKRYRLC